jgi:uncharacterized protein (DUF488 family)
MTIYTIGHSHTPIERFTELLKRHRIDTLIDVRSQPHSRFVPQFNRQALQTSVAQMAMAYRYLGDKWRMCLHRFATPCWHACPLPLGEG